MIPAYAVAARGDLEEIGVAAADVLAFTAGLDDAGLAMLPDTDRRTFRALKNALVEIGESVNRLPSELRGRHSEVDWRGWAGLRDVASLRHFGPDLPRLHPVIVDELPALIAAVAAELAQTDAERADGHAGLDGGAHVPNR